MTCFKRNILGIEVNFMSSKSQNSKERDVIHIGDYNKVITRSSIQNVDQKLIGVIEFCGEYYLSFFYLLQVDRFTV
jgi:hypothetical protein